MSDLCVCAEPLVERTKFPCGHELCLSCGLKQRVLMKDRTCPYCRSHASVAYVVSDGSTDPSKAQINFNPGDLKVENKDLSSRLRHILNYACPECDVENKNYKALKQHLQAEHDRTVCDVCTRHEYIFSDEYQLIAPNKIKEHLKKKHIYCKYCNSYHYGSTEFLKHCRQVHIGCIVCERVNPDKPLYFKAYGELKKHYMDKHYMCMVPSCLEDKHIVFQTEMELQKHMLEAHRGLLNNLRRAQTVSLDKLSLDTEAEGGDSGAQSDSKSDAVAIAQQEKEEVDRMNRYHARLEIAADHNEDNIKKLEAANTTFMTKNVPVMIFVISYESVLSNATPSEITALLVAFKKAYKSQLPDKAVQSLDFVIHQRTKSEEAQSKANDKSSGSSDASASTSSSTKQRAGPAPVEIQKYNWGLAVPRAGGVKNVAELPKLGNSGGQNKKITASAPAAATWKPKASGTSGKSLQNLPSLTKKTPQVGGALVSERQTTIPLREPHNRARHIHPFTSHLSQSPALHSSSSSMPAPSTSSAVSSSAKNTKGTRSNIQLGNLPTLAKPAKPESDASKKKLRGVIRMV